MKKKSENCSMNDMDRKSNNDQNKPVSNSYTNVYDIGNTWCAHETSFEKTNYTLILQLHTIKWMR